MRVPAPGLAFFELRRFRGRLPKLALVFVLLVPLLYGAVYLAANWDPYGRLRDLPVAVVNHDRPVEVNGKTMDAGADFVTSLHEKNDFDWHDVGQAEADRGLREGDYYLVVDVPSDFSANLVSGQGDDPRRAKIMLRRDDANGFIVGSLTDTAENTIALSVDQSAVASYFEAVFANLATIRSGFVEAAQGADRLDDGLGSASSGAEKLATGAATAADDTQKLSAGADTLANGLGTARSGTRELATGLDTLAADGERLSSGAARVAAGNKRLNDRVQPPLKAAQQALPAIEADAKVVSRRLDSIAQRAAGRTSSISSDLSTAAGQLAALQAQHPEVADSRAFREVQARLDAAAGRADAIAADVRTGAKHVDEVNAQVQSGSDLGDQITAARRDLEALDTGSAAVARGAAELDGGIRRAASGADRVSSGVGQAADGATRLASGANRLSDGVDELSTGADSLRSGLTELRDGAGTLADRLDDGARRIPRLSPDQQDRAVQVLSAPADVTMTVDHDARVYGRGLAPLFFSIALWVFGISAFLVVRTISGRALAGRAGPLRLALTAWLPTGAVAVAGGWLMIGVVWASLGLDPVHPVLVVAVVTLAAISFSALAHLLRTALGLPGSSLLLVLLILQLAASGGTYPPPLLPGFFAALHPFLPMSYLVDAFRVTISGGQMAHLARDAAVLLLIAVGALGLLVVTVRRRQQFAMADLHPPLVEP